MLFLAENSNVIEILTKHLFGLRFVKLKFSVIAWKSHLKINTFEEKWKAFNNLENGISNKDVSDKYVVPKKTLCG